jgi:DNA-directed RNA polymerase specialized sigma24 family protein
VGRGKRAFRRSERSFEWSTSESDGTFDLSQALPADSPDPHEAAERKEQLAERRRAIAALKHDERHALWLLALGLSYAEICDATGWTHTKVNRCLSEGRAALRERSAS